MNWVTAMNRWPAASGAVGDIADIDEAEAEPRHARAAVQEPLDGLQRIADVVVQNRADDGPGVDRCESVLLAALIDQIPSRQLGDGLRPHIGCESRVVGISPVLLVQDLGVSSLGEPDGGD